MLKKILLTALNVVAIPGVCIASGVDHKRTTLEYCRLIEQQASIAMFDRQRGVKFSEQMQKKIPVARWQEIVIEAYKAPMVVGENLSYKIVTDYGNKWYGECLRNTRSFFEDR